MKSAAGPEPSSSRASDRYLETARFFLRLGLTGFGGPLALVAEMQRELVEKRGWISPAEFRQVFTLIKSMPGPLAYQTALYLGLRRSDRWGAMIAGVLLLLPATLMMIALAAAYDGFQQSADLVALMAGFQMGALALIALALRGLIKGYEKSVRFWTLAALGFAALQGLGISEPLVILAAGFWSLFLDRFPRRRAPLEAAFSLGLLIWICLKAGAFVFGTGLAIVPLLERDFVHETGWLTGRQFMDALAFGQLTPGPVTVTVTFVGYKMDALRGALLATAAVFLPSTFHQLTWFPRFNGWMSRQAWVEPFVLGATAAITAGIAGSILTLGQRASATQLAILAAAVAASLKWKVPGWALILGAGAAAWAVIRISS